MRTKGRLSASTEIEAKNAKPQDKLYRLSYGDGLQLEVRPQGGKFWVYRYNKPITKKPTVYTLGEFVDNKKPPHVTLAQARALLVGVKAMVKQGIDPNEQKRRDKVRALGATFQAVALEWYENQLGRWSAVNAKQVHDCLVQDVFPLIGGREIAGLEALDFLQVIRQVEGRGALDKAAKVKQRMGAVMRYAVATGRVKYNPVPDLGVAMKAKESGKHYKALGRDDLPVFLKALAAYRSEVMRRAVQFALLTFARTGSIRAAEWVEIDWAGKVWNIPSDHMKMGEPHIIPLSRQALTLLEELRIFTGDSNLIFYTHSRHKPLSSNALLSVLRYMGWKDKTTIHGFRAVASSILHDAGFDSHIIEKQLAHADRNKVASAYNYMAQYLPQRIQMMQWWADYLDDQQGMGKIITGNFARDVA